MVFGSVSIPNSLVVQFRWSFIALLRQCFKKAVYDVLVGKDKDNYCEPQNSTKMVLCHLLEHLQLALRNILCPYVSETCIHKIKKFKIYVAFLFLSF